MHGSVARGSHIARGWIVMQVGQWHHVVWPGRAPGVAHRMVGQCGALGLAQGLWPVEEGEQWRGPWG